MSDSDIERRIVAGLIVSDEFAGRVRPLWRDDLVESPEVVRIARWCTDYFDRYGRAPGRHVEDIYMRELRADRVPKAEAEIIERILARISDDYERGEQFNAAYLFDRAAEYFRSREITRHNERVQDLVDVGDVAAADEAVRAFRPTSWATSRG
ncbi:MAG: hypothetical protein KGJ68_15455, partial [Gammaproteobacteria bacterium]|nr:hypothetical protein [Gammaproteobacteria bacterium]